MLCTSKRTNPLMQRKFRAYFLRPTSSLLVSARLLPRFGVHIIVVQMHHPGDFMDTKHSFVGSRVFAAIATFALTAGTVAFAQKTATPSDNTQSTQSSTATSKPSKAERKAARKERKEKMGKELGLTADQKKQMKALKQDQRKQMKAVKDDT